MKLRLEKEINAPAEKVWDVLAHQFAEISEWAPRIESSRVINISEVPAHFKVAGCSLFLICLFLVGRHCSIQVLLFQMREKRPFPNFL